MLSQALGQGYRASCVTADADYGKSPELRSFLQSHKLAFGLGIKKNLQIQIRTTKLGKLKQPSKKSETTPEQLAQQMKASDWLQIPLQGSQGPSVYEWCYIPVFLEGERYGLLMRRQEKEVRFFLSWSPEEKELLYWVRQIAGRWDIERSFQEAKQELGLDEYQVRTWQAWHRHLVLVWVMLWIMNLLKIRYSPEKWTLPQIRQLMCIPWLAAGIAESHLYKWLHWRRKHNFKAAKSHRKRRYQQLLDRASSYVTL